MLDPEFKAKWVAALRSGEFTQASDALELSKDGKVIGNCCLGVGCRVLGLTPDGHEQPDFMRADATVHSFDGTWSTLSERLLRQFGIDEDAAQYLANLNDGGTSFSEIADYIEANLQ